MVRSVISSVTKAERNSRLVTEETVRVFKHSRRRYGSLFSNVILHYKDSQSPAVLRYVKRGRSYSLNVRGYEQRESGEINITTKFKRWKLSRVLDDTGVTQTTREQSRSLSSPCETENKNATQTEKKETASPKVLLLSNMEIFLVLFVVARVFLSSWLLSSL